MRALRLAGAVLLVAAPAASAESETTSSGTVAAVMSWTPDPGGLGASDVSSMLRIRWAAAVPVSIAGSM